MTIGEKIRKMRKFKDLTQGDISILADLSTPQLSWIENDRVDPKLSTLRSLASALEMTLCELFEDVE